MKVLAWSLCLLMACGGAASEAAGLRQLRLARATHEDAAKAAPELFQRYESTQRKALESKPETPARADYESEARLWLEAAIAEGERVHLSEARLAVERETATLEASALEHERERAALAAEAERDAAREIVRREAELALARSALAPQHRVKLGRAEVELAANSVIARAALVQLALHAYGVPEAQVSPLESKLSRARSVLAKSPDEALSLADDSLYASLALLGVLRGSEGVASELERASLAEQLSQSGAQLARNERGLAVVLAQPFATTHLQPATQRLLSHLCALAQGYPKGPVQLTLASHPAGVAESRASIVREQLTRLGCAGPRFSVQVLLAGGRARFDTGASTPGSRASTERLELTWLAY